MTGDQISVRAVLELLLDADRCPRYNAHDWREADFWEKEALAKAETVIGPRRSSRIRVLDRRSASARTD
jgi:hypothetical protein